DPLTADDERVAVDDDVAAEAAVHRVVAQHVGEGGGLAQVDDRDDLDVREVLDRGAKHHASDAAEAVDADLDGHGKKAPWMAKKRLTRARARRARARTRCR